MGRRLNKYEPMCLCWWGHGGVVVNALEFRSVVQGTGDILLALILYHVPLLTSVDLMLSGYGDSQM